MATADAEQRAFEFRRRLHDMDIVADKLTDGEVIAIGEAIWERPVDVTMGERLRVRFRDEAGWVYTQESEVHLTLSEITGISHPCLDVRVLLNGTAPIRCKRPARFIFDKDRPFFDGELYDATPEEIAEHFRRNAMYGGQLP